MKALPVADAVALIPDGARLMIGGFMAVGSPGQVIDELVRQGKRDLTVIAFHDGRAMLMETAPGVSVQQVVDATEAELVVPAQVPAMAL